MIKVGCTMPFLKAFLYSMRLFRDTTIVVCGISWYRQSYLYNFCVDWDINNWTYQAHLWSLVSKFPYLCKCNSNETRCSSNSVNCCTYCNGLFILILCGVTYLGTVECFNEVWQFWQIESVSRLSNDLTNLRYVSFCLFLNALMSFLKHNSWQTEHVYFGVSLIVSSNTCIGDNVFLVF